jgi:hypothetical protein
MTSRFVDDIVEDNELEAPLEELLSNWRNNLLLSSLEMAGSIRFFHSNNYHAQSNSFKSTDIDVWAGKS